MRTIVLLFIFAVCQLCLAVDDTNVINMSEWSKPVSLRNDQLHDGLIRGRMLILKGMDPAYGGPPTTNGTMTFVELQNVTGSCCEGIDFYFDVKKLKCELTDSAGMTVPLPGGGWSGPVPSVPCWLKLPHNSTIRLYVSPGTLAPLTVYPGGEPGCYWSIAGTDTNTYFWTGTLILSTRTNLSLALPPQVRAAVHEEHCTATLEFPRVKITLRAPNK